MGSRDDNWEETRKAVMSDRRSSGENGNTYQEVLLDKM